MGGNPEEFLIFYRSNGGPPQGTPGRPLLFTCRTSSRDLNGPVGWQGIIWGEAQQQYKRYNDRMAKERRVQVLVCGTLFPHKKTAIWEGPFQVLKVLGPVTYEVQCEPGRPSRKRLHEALENPAPQGRWQGQ